MCYQHVAENVHKRFGQKYKPLFWQIARAQSEIAFEEFKKLFRLFDKTLCKLRSIYSLLATRPLPLLNFHTLDLATIPLIQSNQLIQSGERFESFHHFSFLMRYISGMLRLFTSVVAVNQLLGTQFFQTLHIEAIRVESLALGVIESFLHQRVRD